MNRRPLSRHVQWSIRATRELAPRVSMVSLRIYDGGSWAQMYLRAKEGNWVVNLDPAPDTYEDLLEAIGETLDQSSRTTGAEAVADDDTPDTPGRVTREQLKARAAKRTSGRRRSGRGKRR